QRQNGGRGVFLLEIFKDRERLEQRGAVVLHQRRQRHLRIDAAILVGGMRVGVEIDEDDLGRHVFQIEREAGAKARQRSPEGEEFHGALSYPSPLRGRDERSSLLGWHVVSG